MWLFQVPWMTKLLKRLCKSLLKKWLGDLILGDLDVDQLNIQLVDGEFYLSDIALNAEVINSKLSGSSIMVKEGSIESLLVKFPWHEDFKASIQEKCKCCEIKVEKLELVLVPSVVSEVPHVDTECSVYGSNSDTHILDKTQINESDSNRCSMPVSIDVDEGVKRIAYAVKWFLTSFNIKLDKVFVVFDPQAILDNKALEFNRLLAFRLEEIVFETGISQVGPPKLHNIVRFEKAAIEFLKTDDVDAVLQKDLDVVTAYSSSGHSTTAVLTGPVGGFSGELKLIIPWSDGSLNLEKIDADVTIHSLLELRLQMSSIQWFMDVWDYVQKNAIDDQSCVYNTANMSVNTSRSILCSSASSSSKSGSDSMNVMSGREGSVQNTFSQSRQDQIPDSFTMVHVIPNWIPELIHEDQGDPDSDCDESIDQFFECFEELRNSQTNFGNSGIWDWTCSIFNAITFASTLASGSDQVPKEPPIEKNLKASIPEISVILLFSDEMDTSNSSVPLSPFNDMRNSEMFSSCLSFVDFEQSLTSPATASSINMHHLDAKFQKIGLNLKTYPKTLSFKASIGHMMLDEYYSTENHDPDHPHFGSIFLNNNFRREVQASLPPFPSAAQDYRVETSGRSNELIKVELLKTFGDCTLHYDVSSTDQDGKSISSTSLSIVLAPLIFWVHFHTAYMVLNFISKIESDVLHGEHKFHRHHDEKSNELSARTNNSPSENLKKIQINLSTARIIFCFPSESSWNLGCPSTLDIFIAIDNTSSVNFGEASPPLQNERRNDVHPGAPSSSLRLAAGNIDIYLVRCVNNGLDGGICTLSKQAFSALKIFSVTGSNCPGSSIAMIWRNCPASDPDMVNKAWSLPQLHDRKIAQKENGKWTGISSCSTSEDLEESSSCICQELIQSTEFLLHVQLSCVSVHLSKKDCVVLNELLDHILNGCSTDGPMSSENDKEQSMSSNTITTQTSVIFECSSLDICTELDETVGVGPLLQTELEGSWNRLKLSVSKFSMYSFSNVGGVNSTSFLRVNHGEGELWGSITSTDDKTCQESKDFLLVVCKDSASRRGDGKGNNLLSFGTAGCSVTHIRNPKLQENYTSVNVRSGTIVAPGGRMDWISAICLLFSSDSHGEQSYGSSRIHITQADEPFSSSFFLELVDVAVSYEPHFKNSAVAPECKFFSGLVAASSFKLHNKSKSNSPATDFDIQLRDLGFLICGSFDSKNVTEGYGADYLRKMGYTKIGQNTFIEAALRIDTSFWKLEVSESQFDIGTCHDTTYGLVRLCSQLQQLYAPDMQDALVHLQSRWNSVQQANKQNMTSDTSDKSKSSIDNLSDSGECKSDGLLDDIIENAFFTDQDCTVYNIWNENGPGSLNISEMVDEFELHTSTNESTGVKVSCVSPGSSLVTAQIPLRQNSCPEQIIDSYYMPELLYSSSLNLCNEDHQCTSADDAGKTVNFEDGGWYNNIPLTIVENHVSRRNSPQGDDVFQQERKPSDSSLESDGSCNLKGKVHINSIDVKWRMYAGDDWPLAQKDATSCSSSNGRDRNTSLEFIISRLNVQFDLYPDGDVSVSKLSISAQDVNLCDQSMRAPWKLVLGCYNSKDYPRESCSSAFRLELEAVRPEPRAPLEDYRLRLEILPLQLHLHQGQLNFLINFFQNGSSNNQPQVPCENEIVDVDNASYGNSAIVDEALLPFFQKFDVKPLVLHINYIPRKFDPVALGKGKYAELLNILPLKGIDLKLKHVSAKGVYGWNSICETVAAEWLEDISKNQVHKLLKGLPPIKSLVAICSGTKKLFSSPIKSYKKDRKLLKGMQRGAVAFIRSISIEAVGLGLHLSAGAHDILLKTEGALTAVPPPIASSEATRAKDNIRANQPENAQQGMKQAYESLTDGLGRTASALIGNPIKVYNRGAGAVPALAAAICGAPGAILTPMSASARAAQYAFLGMKNSLDPEHKKESMSKYLGPSQL